MVTELFLNIIFQLVEWILSPIPNLSLNLNWGATSSFWGVVRCVLYMLPLGTIAAIVSLLILISTFRIFVSIVKTIWDLLPLV